MAPDQRRYRPAAPVRPAAPTGATPPTERDSTLTDSPQNHPALEPVPVGPSTDRPLPAPLPRGHALGSAAEGLSTRPSTLGDLLADTAPGPALARFLADLDREHTSDADLVEAVAAAIRQEAWTHARTVALAAELARRPAMNPTMTHSADPSPENGCIAGDELALRLGATRYSTRALIREGIAYDGVLASTGEALATGHLDPAKARVVVNHLADLPYELTDPIEQRLLPDADRRTPPQLARDLERAILDDLGDLADQVHQRARNTRRVGRPRLLPDGMASLYCVLPAPEAAQIDAVLDACARTARHAGDPRTLAQLRADGLRDLIIAEPDTSNDPAVGAAPDTPADPSSPAPERPRVNATVHITVSLPTLLGLDDEPADLSGVGPIAAHQARDLALSAGSTWHRLVTDPLSGAILDVGRHRYRPPTALADHVRARDRTCARPGCSVPASRCDLDHTIEFHTSAPGAPPGERHLRGSTEPGNLGPLCAHDHRLKTEAGFVLRQIAPGVFEWTSPLGKRYRTVPGADQAYTRLPSVEPGTPVSVAAAPRF